MNRYKFTLIASLSLLYGCSSSPSNGDIKESLENSVNCELLKFHDIEKKDTYEKTVDGDIYYVTDFSFKATMKYSGEWEENYKKHLNKVSDFEKTYNKYEEKFDKLKADKVNKINNLLAEYKEKEINIRKSNKQIETREEYLELEHKIRENTNLILQEIENFKINDVPLFESLAKEYSKKAGGDSFIENNTLDYNTFSNFLTYYPFIKKDVIPSFNPSMPSKCINTDSLTRKIILPIYSANNVAGFAKPKQLSEGLSAEITMKSYLKKTEKGWHIFE